MRSLRPSTPSKSLRAAIEGCRFCKLLARIGSDMGQSIPLVCQDWANT
ncbi:transposase DNA-binding-containing protein, partial [Bradyrhizobium sp. USDA 3458]